MNHSTSGKRLHIVGAGKWAVTVAKVARSLGVETCHSRLRTDKKSDPSLGPRVDFDVLDVSLERSLPFTHLFVAAPPSVTKSFAHHIASSLVPSMFSKPLMDYWFALGDSFMCDYVHLYSPCYRVLKEVMSGRPLDGIDIKLAGHGPRRDVPGLFDYGAHAMSMLYDLMGGPELKVQDVEVTREEFGELHEARCTLAGVPLKITIGNGSKAPLRQLKVFAQNGDHATYSEKRPEAVVMVNGHLVRREPEHNPLLPLLKDFLFSGHGQRTNHAEMTSWIDDSLNKILRASSPSP